VLIVNCHYKNPRGKRGFCFGGTRVFAVITAIAITVIYLLFFLLRVVFLFAGLRAAFLLVAFFLLFGAAFFLRFGAAFFLRFGAAFFLRFGAAFFLRFGAAFFLRFGAAFFFLVVFLFAGLRAGFLFVVLRFAGLRRFAAFRFFAGITEVG